MASIYDWSTTAGNNSSADSGINWAEGQDPGTVNDSARQVMGRVAEILGDLGGALSAGGTANGLTVTANSAFTTLANGRLIAFRAIASNTGAATLNVNGLGAKAIRKMSSSGDVALTANDIRNTGLYIGQYSTALNGAAGGWLLVNPTLSAAIYSLSGLVTVDNTVPRFDGTAGAFQTTAVVISDANAITGVTTLTTSGAITGSTITASTGVFIATSGGITLRPNTGDANQDTTIDTNGNMTVGGTIASGLIGATGTITATSTISGTAITATTGLFVSNAGGVTLRPNTGDTNQDTTIDTSGNMVVGGTITATGTITGSTITAATGVFIATAGGITLRANPSDTGQDASIDTGGNMTIRGTLTVTG